MEYSIKWPGTQHHHQSTPEMNELTFSWPSVPDKKLDKRRNIPHPNYKIAAHRVKVSMRF